MTIQKIIKLLKTSGIDSKHQVINQLENMTADEALELILSIINYGHYKSQSYLKWGKEIDDAVSGVFCLRTYEELLKENEV